MKRASIHAAAGSVLLLGSLALAGTSSALTVQGDDTARAVERRGALNPLNNSGGVGRAEIDVFSSGRVDVDVDARRVLAGSPHAMHIHFGAKARNECPTIADDDNGDFRLTTAEGAPAYGPVRASLTTRGDTSPASVLAVERFPTSPKGEIHYDRSFGVGDRLAMAIKGGKGVIVVHGVDYNANGKYDFMSAGESELDPSLPAEATDPAICGVINKRP